VDSSGKAVFTSGELVVGQHILNAVYNGNEDYPASTSAALKQAVKKAATKVGLTSSPNPAALGETVILTASVTVNSPGAGTPSGNVAFVDGKTSLGSVELEDGQAVLEAELSGGTHALKAVYAGDENFSTATSSKLNQKVSKSNAVVAVEPYPDVSSFGENVTFTVTASSDTGTPGGKVTLKDGTKILKSAILDGSGKATFAISTLSAGNHAVTVLYAGDASFNSAASSVLAFEVNKAVTSTTLTALPNPSNSGQQVTFTAQVTCVSGKPAGKVTFKDEGDKVLGTATIAKSTGIAIFKTKSLSSGIHSITAVFSGDSSFEASEMSVTLTVQ